MGYVKGVSDLSELVTRNRRNVNIRVNTWVAALLFIPKSQLSAYYCCIGHKWGLTDHRNFWRQVAGHVELFLCECDGNGTQPERLMQFPFIPQPDHLFSDSQQYRTWWTDLDALMPWYRWMFRLWLSSISPSRIEEELSRRGRVIIQWATTSALPREQEQKMEDLNQYSFRLQSDWVVFLLTCP